MGCAGSTSKSAAFADVDTNKDGSVSAEELAKVLESHGEPDAANRAKKMLEKYDTNKDGVLQEAEYQGFLSELASTASKDEDLSHVNELADVHQSDPLRGKAAAILDAAKAACATLNKDGPCGFVLADHMMNEVACTCEPKGKLLIKLARQKIRAIAKFEGDFSKMLASPPLPMGKLLASLSGMSDVFPVEGVIHIEYAHPETAQPVRGYFATSGRSKSAQDVFISQKGATGAGLVETESPHVYRLVL
jgi:hypothetical protein